MIPFNIIYSRLRLINEVIEDTEVIIVDFYVISLKVAAVAIVVISPLVRFFFYDLIFPTIRCILVGVVRKALFYLYLNSAPSLALRDRRTGVAIAL